MATNFETGQRVRWRWGQGHGEGTVRARFTERVECTIKGQTVVRNADTANPAYLVEQDDGDEVLKSASELERA